MTVPSRRALVALVLASSALLPGKAAAQLSTTRGLSLGAYLQGTSLTIEGGDVNSGGGLGLRAGYGFNRIVTGFLHIDGAKIDVPDGSDLIGEWGLAHGEIGARFHFANSLRRWVPYLETSVGARAVTVKNASVEGEDANSVSFNGGAFTVGGGLNTFFNKSLSLDVSLRWTGGKFSEIDLGSVAVRNLDIDAASFRFGVGLVWWP